VSSGNSASLFTCSGKVSADDCTSSNSTASSISPVASLGFTASAPRATTWPVRVTTLSRRSAEACSKQAPVALTTHWVTPKLSRRSMKSRCPWSRLRWTQPERRAGWPTCVARSSPQVWVR
jgi:hypothetical protein